MSNQELTSGLPAGSTPRPSPAVVGNQAVPEAIRTERGFVLALHQALRDFQRPDRLRDTPLLGSRLVTTALQRAPDAAPTQALRELIRKQCDRFGENPKTSRFQQVLQHTYLAPLRSQQAAADAMHLSWSTYRRCLANATHMLSVSLWESESVLRETPAGKHLRAWPWYAAAAMLVLIVAAGSATFIRAHRRRQETIPTQPATTAAATPNIPATTLAVLPFMDLDKNPSSHYLSDGITDELITRLGRNPALRVVAHTSSFSLRDKPLDVRDVGRILGVNNVVEGSVQQTGESLRIHVALVNAADGYELWSDELTAPRSAVFKTEQTIADAVTAHLHVPVDQSRTADDPRVNPAARDAYLVGMGYLAYRTVPDIQQALNYFQKSIQADSHYAAPWTALATAYTIWRDYSADEPPDTHYQDALNAAQKAVALDPQSANAHAVLGLLYEEHWQWRQADQEIQLALQLDSSDATAHQWHGMYFWFTGNMQNAVKELSLARELDPLSPIINADLGRTLSYAGEPQQAAVQLRTTVALAPRFGLTYTFMAENDIAMGNYQQALDDVQIASNIWGNPSEPFLVMETAAANVGLGRRDLATQELAELQQRASQHYLSGVMLAWPLWSLGKKAEALDQLQRAARDHDHQIMIAFGSNWAGLRADPRFAEVRKIMNLPSATTLH
ncbi:MAG: hypothetical protein WCC11_07595 [Gammaproteobacteria bacterium]